MNYKEVDFRKVSFKEISLNKQSKNKQYKLFPRYNEEYFIIKSPEIEINQHGIQKHNEKFYKTKESRNFIKLPIDNEENKEFKLFLQKIDDYIKRNKKRILKQFSNAEQYIYSPFIKSKENENIQDYVKLKFNTDYQTNEYLTKFYINKEKQEVNDIDDVDKICPFKSKVRVIMLFNKLWIAKNRDVNKNYNFGLSAKILQMKIEPAERKKQFSYDEYAFED